jgi:hypothetical protein
VANTPTTSLQVRDILDSRPYIRETRVRTIAPAIVFVLEQEAPIRMLSTALSTGEWRALLAWIRSNPEARQFADAYSDARTMVDGTGEDFEAVDRERRHERRLEHEDPPYGTGTAVSERLANGERAEGRAVVQRSVSEGDERQNGFVESQTRARAE